MQTTYHFFKTTITLVVLLCLSPQVAYAGGVCKEDTLVFACTTENNKQLKVCENQNAINYSFGKKNHKPELFLTNTHKQITSKTWQGVGNNRWQQISFYNGKTKYTVFSDYERKPNGKKTGGVLVDLPNKPSISIYCNASTMTDHLDAYLNKANESDVNALYNALSKATKEPVSQLKHQHKVAFKDLNQDGLLDALVYFIDTSNCGSGGCYLGIYQQNLSDKNPKKVSSISFKKVSGSTVTQLPIYLQKTNNKGWRDLTVTIGGGGVKTRMVTLLFNGKHYPKNPTINSQYITQHPINTTANIKAKGEKILYFAD